MCYPHDKNLCFPIFVIMHILESNPRRALTALLVALSMQIPALAAPPETKLTFAEMGVDSMALHGVQSSAAVNIGIRRDEVVTGAVLHLRLTYSPSLLQDLSHLRIAFNGQSIAAVPLPKSDAGHEVERDIDLDPRYFSDYNQIRFDLIGHYSLECEDPEHSSIWATISGQSDLILTLRPIELRDDLGYLPAPFFDAHDNRRLDLPIVLPAGASRDIVRSAGVAASWFGMLADYRERPFSRELRHAARTSRLGVRNESLQARRALLAGRAEPTLSIVDHPKDPSVKLLVFQGRDEAQLRQAVEGLVLGNAVLTGIVRRSRRSATSAAPPTTPRAGCAPTAPSS